MDSEERESNGGVSDLAVKKLKSCPVVVGNGDGNSVGSSGGVLQTYKRRRRTEVVDGANVSGDSASHVFDKSIKGPWDSFVNRSSCIQAGLVHVKPHGALNDPSDSAVRSWKNVVLEQILQSLESDGGLKECIQEALASHPEASCAVKAKKSQKSCEDEKGCCLPSHFVHQGIQNGTKAVSNGAVNEPSHCTVTKRCQHMFTDIVRSEKFAQLCNVLYENFGGTNIGKYFEIGLIHMRMKDGSYEGSPLLFHSDVQQMWTKLHNVGSEIIALSESLSERSRASFRQMDGSMQEISGNGKNEFIIHEFDKLARTARAEACDVNKICACRRCGNRANGRDCLVCDSCEEIYHVACIEPPVKQIPSSSWYCARCIAKGAESPHENCVVCERLNASESLIIEDGVEELMTQDMLGELEECSNGLVDDELSLFSGKSLPHCCVCKTEVTSNENFRVCGHSFCPHKFYHERCLNRKQSDSYGSCWYCPSCLCRGCLKNCDDDKIVLCDSCDHAYHIYCMEPPCTSIPSGNWFCQKCNREMQHIQKAKRTFENLQNKLIHRAEVPKGKNDEVLSKSGGVDMLLNAAKTLNHQENLAAM